MRPHLRALIALLLALVPSALSAQAGSATTLNRVLERLAKGENVQGLPTAAGVAPGEQVVPAGASVHGTIVARGSVDVSGVVDGSVVSLSGDVTVHPGGHVMGDALAVSGRVIADSGRVDGEMRTMSALPLLIDATTLVAAVPTPAQRTITAVRLVVGSFGVLLVVAIGVLLFAGPNLNEVVGTVERHFARAFWVGIAGQLLILPGLVVLCIALALTLIGVLLVPFAVVAYAIAVAGIPALAAVSRSNSLAMLAFKVRRPPRAAATVAADTALPPLWASGAYNVRKCAGRRKWRIGVGSDVRYIRFALSVPTGLRELPVRRRVKPLCVTQRQPLTYARPPSDY